MLDGIFKQVDKERVYEISKGIHLVTADNIDHFPGFYEYYLIVDGIEAPMGINNLEELIEHLGFLR